MFQEFATQAENIFRGSERHTDLDKAYNRLVRTIFDNINRISEDHPKTPREVIMMGMFLYENAKKKNTKKEQLFLLSVVLGT